MDMIEHVKDYVTNELIPNEQAPPEEYREEFVRMGFFKLGHSTKFGGLGLTLEEQVRVQMQFGRTKLGFRNIFSTTTTLASWLLDTYGFGTELAEINKGEVVSMAFTDPDKDANNMHVTEHRGKIYVSGDKRFISNSPKAGMFIVYANDTLWLVPKSSKVTVSHPYEKMGQDENPVADIHFDAAEADGPLGQRGMGLILADQAFTRGRLIVSAVSAGMSIRLCDEMTTYAKQRGVFQHQLVKALIADSVAKTYAAKATVIEAAKNLNPVASSAAKLFCTNVVNEVADNAVQVMGGYGYMRGSIVEQFYRDARVFRLYEGTDQIQQLNIAKHFREGALNDT